MIDVSGIGAFLGLDVGKGEHHALILQPTWEEWQQKGCQNISDIRQGGPPDGRSAGWPVSGRLHTALHGVRRRFPCAG